MVPQANGARNGNVSLNKIENGYAVHYSRENKKLSADGNNFLYDYESATFAFSTLEEAVAKIQELGAAL